MVYSANIDSGMFQTISMDLLWVFNNPQIVAFLLLWKFTVPVPSPFEASSPLPLPHCCIFFFPVWKFIEPVPASSEAPNFPPHPHLCCISELQPVFDNCEQGEKQTDKNHSWIFEKNVVFLCFTCLCILSNNSMSSFPAEVEEGDW